MSYTVLNVLIFLNIASLRVENIAVSAESTDSMYSFSIDSPRIISNDFLSNLVQNNPYFTMP